MDRHSDLTDAREAATGAPPPGLDLLSDDDWNDLSYFDFVARLEQHWPKYVQEGRGPEGGEGRYVRFCRKCAARCSLSEREYLDKQPYTCAACGHKNVVQRAPYFSVAAALREAAWGIALLGLLLAVVVFPALGALGIVGVVFMWTAICVSGAVGLFLIVAVRVSAAELKGATSTSPRSADTPG